MQDYLEGKPYVTECACGCGYEFNGRKNQKFLNERHKSKHNNALRSERNKKLTPYFKKMEVSYRLLKKAYDRGDNNAWIKISDLTRDGFDPNIPVEQEKDQYSGEITWVLANYGFRISQNGLEIWIVKLAD